MVLGRPLQYQVWIVTAIWFGDWHTQVSFSAFTAATTGYLVLSFVQREDPREFFSALAARQPGQTQDEECWFSFRFPFEPR